MLVVATPPGASVKVAVKQEEVCQQQQQLLNGLGLIASSNDRRPNKAQAAGEHRKRAQRPPDITHHAQ